jgi:hypothetical protein
VKEKGAHKEDEYTTDALAACMAVGDFHSHNIGGDALEHLAQTKTNNGCSHADHECIGFK